MHRSCAMCSEDVYLFVCHQIYIAISHWFALDLLIYLDILHKPTSTKASIFALLPFIGIKY